jgi:hypothetical protein
MRECAALAQSSDVYFANAVRFAAISARVPFERVGSILDDIDRNGAAADELTRPKRDLVAALESPAVVTALRAACDDAARRRDDVALVDALSRMPALGLVKAGFVAQLVYGRVGCLDTHNLALYGIPQNATRLYGRGSIARYVARCERTGAPLALWARWCAHVSALRPEQWPTAEAVSARHVDYVRGAPLW